MSATRDRSQKFAFVYTNFYELYKKSQAKEAGAATGALTGIHKEELPSQLRDQPWASLSEMPKAQVIKVGDYKSQLGVKPFVPAPLSPAQPQNQAIDSLKNNLKNLQDLHSKLKYVLSELKALGEQGKGQKGPGSSET